jgi:hypothetical protein
MTTDEKKTNDKKDEHVPVTHILEADTGQFVVDMLNVTTSSTAANTLIEVITTEFSKKIAKADELTDNQNRSD